MGNTESRADSALYQFYSLTLGKHLTPKVGGSEVKYVEDKEGKVVAVKPVTASEQNEEDPNVKKIQDIEGDEVLVLALSSEEDAENTSHVVTKDGEEIIVQIVPEIEDVEGGCGCVFGGYSDLENYANSMYSEAKEKLIRGIAQDVMDALKVNNKFVSSAPIKDVVERLRKVVPDPRAKKTLKTDKNIHIELCRKLARSINKRYDMDIIDEDASPEVICQKVSEIIYSLFTGLHTEFLTISGDISRTLRNLDVLKQYVDSANRKLASELSKAAGDVYSTQAESIQKLYDILSKEIDRQHTILANLTNAVIGPVGTSLVTILEDNRDFAGLTKDLEKITGTPQFSERLSYLLSGTSNIAHAAQIVDKALKDIGMSVEEYRSVKDLHDLRSKIYNHMLQKKVQGEELYKLLAAADVLYRQDTSHEDIAQYLEKHKNSLMKKTRGGAAMDVLTPSFADMADTATTELAADNPFKGRTQSYRKSVSKQLLEKEQLRKQIFTVFNSQVKHKYDKIRHSISVIGKKVGSEIEITPELDLFIKQLNNFASSQPDKQNLHIALSGYRRDTGSAYVKHQFMGNLMSISDVAQDLIKGKAGHYFQDIKNNTDDLIKLVDEFTINFAGTLNNISITIKHKPIDDGYTGGNMLSEESLEDDHEEQSDSKEQSENPHRKSAESNEEEEKAGGYENIAAIQAALAEVIAKIPEVEFQHFKTMRRSIREIDYYYRIANIKYNISNAAGEYETNTENYENILGEEAGYIIDQINMRADNLMQALETTPTPGTAPLTNIKDLYAFDYALSDGTRERFEDKLGSEIKYVKEEVDDNGKKAMDNYVSGYKFLIEYIRTSKIEMLEAAQALDLYLSRFTKNIQLNHDQIKSFVQVLEQIEVVAKWFTDKSGDNLAQVFESFDNSACEQVRDFPCGVDMGGFDAFQRKHQDVRNTLDILPGNIPEKHYYETLGEHNPGRFYLPRMLTRDQAINLVKQIEKSIKSVRALENIIATFSKVNVNVSGDVKTFMSAGLMFKAFMKYCVASVISVGYLCVNDKDTLAFENMNPANAALSNRLKSIHAKMAVGLRFHKEKIKWSNNQNLVLCDPLRVSEKKSAVRYGDICDKIFEMSIKSMVSKIFTVVGTYTLFQKPLYDKQNPLSLPTNPLRQILGGAPEEIIIPDATELYIRLPLLVEWYRKVFEFNSTSDRNMDPNPPKQTNPLISIIPDMDNIWGDLLRVIMIDGRNIEDGAYPSDFAHRIIASINNIYLFYQAKEKDISAKKIISELVAEVNRRYGMLMREEINKYFDEKYKYINEDEEYPAEERVDYDLLDVEGQMGRNPAPSDRFRTLMQRRQNKRAHTIEDLHRSVRRFRQAIEANLMLSPTELGIQDPQLGESHFRTIGEVSLSGLIRETKRKLENAKTNEDRYRIVHEQLHGVERFGDLDQQKMLLFHETVIMPLTVLYFTYLLLNDYNKFCVSLRIPTDPGHDIYKSRSFDGTTIANDIIKYNNQVFKGRNNPYVQNDRVKLESLYTNEKIQEYLNDVPIPEYYMNNVHPIQSGSIFSVDIANFNEVRQRFIYKNSKLMEDLLVKLMNVGCDMNDMTDIYFVGSGSKTNYPVLNYDRLEETCTKLLANVKQTFQHMRKYMPQSLIERFENIKLNGHENRISIFYIQEHLIDRLFKNKYGNGLPDANIAMKDIWHVLTKKYSFNGIILDNDNITGINTEGNKRDIPANNNGHTLRPPINDDLLQDMYYNSFNDVFSKLGFWDVTMRENMVLNSLNFRKINGSTELLKFPARYISGFVSGQILGNPKGRNESDIIEKISANKTENIEPLNAKVLSILDAGAGTHHIIAGAHNLYDYNHKYDMDCNLNGVKEHLHARLGLIPKLNNLIYKYCSLFIDASSRKIYKPLLEKFVFGHNSKDIIQGKNINDRVMFNTNDDHDLNISYPAVCLTDPPKNAVLFATIANALKNIMTTHAERAVSTLPLFIEDNFDNLSEYQKELMRAYLPAFGKELNLIVKKASFLRQCLEESQVKVYKWRRHMDLTNIIKSKNNRDSNVTADWRILKNNDDSDPEYTQPNIIPENDNNVTNSHRKTYLIGIFDDLAMSSKSLLRCIDVVQKEINDIPLYFETYHESIIDYNSRNGQIPLMPISHISHLMNFNILRSGDVNDVAYDANANTIQDESNSEYSLALIPQTDVSLGSALFKFTYGTRGLLHYKQKPSVEYAPGMSALLASYNNKVSGGAAMDKNMMGDVVQHTVSLSRWVLDYMYHKQVLARHEWGNMRRLVLENQRNVRNIQDQTGPNGNRVRNLACQTAKSDENVNHNAGFWGKTSNVVLLVENDNIRQSMYRMMACLLTSDNKLYGLERPKFRIYNILDLNIVPINVHAMQREIPFVNILNYSYTFDHMTKNILGVSTKTQKLSEIKGEDDYGNNEYNANFHPEDTMVRHIIYPLGYRRLHEYVNHTYRIMAGNTSLSLGKPRYLSDQLWNKVLMNSLYYTHLDEFSRQANAAQIRDLNEARRGSTIYPGYSNNSFDARDRRLVANQVQYQEPMEVGINIDRTPIQNGIVVENRMLTRSLSYINDRGEVTDVIVFTNTDNNNNNNNNNNKLQCMAYEGYLRYNSKLVRWVEWFAQIQRMVRILMRDQLEWIKDPVVHGNDALSEDITEYKNNNVFSLDDYE